VLVRPRVAHQRPRRERPASTQGSQLGDFPARVRDDTEASRAGVRSDARREANRETEPAARDGARYAGRAPDCEGIKGGPPCTVRVDEQQRRQALAAPRPERLDQLVDESLASCASSGVVWNHSLR
jgi:hypothetical protein